MRKIYQTEWHGIELAPLMKAGKPHAGLPDSDFYAAYYRAFFKQHASPESLAPEWRKLKHSVSDELSRHWIPSPDARILSIGSGLGIIEMDLWQRGFHGLEVTDVCEEPLQWLKRVLPADQIHVGRFPDCLSADAPYDLIFFCTIDYVFDTPELIHFLKTVRSHLKPGGKALLLTHGLSSSNPFLRFFMTLRERISAWKHHYKKTFRGLFWGYVRSRKDYADAFSQAGFSLSEDGIRATGTAWINYFRVGLR